MTVEPSCPALVIFPEDAFRSALIRTLDEQHFTVTSADGEPALALLRDRPGAFRVILAGVDLNTGAGTAALEYLRDHRETTRCGVIIVGEPDPRLRTWAPWVDETLMKPVDPAYLAARARAYCNC